MSYVQLSDKQTLRERARQHVENGAVTESYSADRETVINLLNEALATELWPAVTSVVVALPDARKGERLVLMTTDTAAARDAFARFARQKGANELMVPADILLVPSVPLLGSGKPDYVAALALAKERMASQPRKAEALVAEPVLPGPVIGSPVV